MTTEIADPQSEELRLSDPAYHHKFLVVDKSKAPVDPDSGVDSEVFMTTDRIDADNEVMLPSGADFSRFDKNPVLLLCHPQSPDRPAYYPLPVGKVPWHRTVKHGIIGGITFSRGTKMGQDCKTLWDEECLRTVSIGFLPGEASPMTRQEAYSRPDWREGWEASGGKIMVHRNYLVTELSVAPLPANEDALRIKHRTKGLPIPTWLKLSKDFDMDQQTKGVASFHEMPVVEGAWDAGAARKRLEDWSGGGDDKEKMDWKKFGKAFLWHADGAKDFGDFKFPIADVRDGKLVIVKEALRAAKSRLNSGDIPEADKEKIASLVEHYFKHAGIDSGDDTAKPKEKTLGALHRTKGVHLGEIEGRMAVAALREIHEQFFYFVVRTLLQEYGDGVGSSMSMEDRLTKIHEAFEEYEDCALRSLGAILTKPEADAKPEVEHATKGFLGGQGAIARDGAPANLKEFITKGCGGEKGMETEGEVVTKGKPKKEEKKPGEMMEKGIRIGMHVKCMKSGGCGIVKSMHADGSHAHDGDEEDPEILHASMDNPVARVHMHDGKHNLIEGKHKSMYCKDMEPMDDEEMEEGEKSVSETKTKAMSEVGGAEGGYGVSVENAKEEAHDRVKPHDFVEIDDKERGHKGVGQVKSIHTDGNFVPHVKEDVIGTEDEPAALVRRYKAMDDGHVRTDFYTAHHTKHLKKCKDLMPPAKRKEISPAPRPVPIPDIGTAKVVKAGIPDISGAKTLGQIREENAREFMKKFEPGALQKALADAKHLAGGGI